MVSILGITIGVAALVVVLSVFNGFNGLVTSILVGFDPHLRIERTSSASRDDIEGVRQWLQNEKGIRGFGAFASGKSMVVSRNQSKVIFVRGIEASKVDLVTGIGKKMVLGKLDFQDSTGHDIVIGLTLADRLGVVTGDSVLLISPAGSQRALFGFGAPAVRSFRISGIYESNNKDYDALYAYMPLPAAQRLLQTETGISGFEVRFNDIGDADDAKASIEKQFGAAFQTSTWYDLHRDLYSVMRIERWTAYLILCLIIGVASFNLLGSLTMSVIAKTRDIGILKTMGATNADITSVFRFEGLMVGVVGTVAGSLLGVLVCLLQQRYHLFALDPTVYIIPAIPVEVHIIDFFSVAIAALGLSYAATIYPSKRAAGLLPAEAIRWE